MSIYYQNANGLRTKLNRFRVATQHSLYNVYVITETGLIDSISSNELFDDSFIVYRCDRSDWSSSSLFKGGVLIAVHVSLRSELLSTGDPLGIEQLWVRVLMGRNQTFLIGVLYIVPQSNLANYEMHLDFACGVLEDANFNDSCFLLGDFNLPNLCWIEDEESRNFMLPLNVRSDAETYVVDNLFSVDMRQINNVFNTNNRILDLVFTNVYDCVAITKSTVPLLPNEIHHFAIELCVSNVSGLNVKNQDTHSNNYAFDFRRSNFEGLALFFTQIDWANLLSNLSADQMVTVFYNQVGIGLKRFTPVVRKRVMSSHPPWMSRVLINLLNRQKKAHSDCVYSNFAYREYQIYSQVRRQVKGMSAFCMSEYTSRMEADLRSNPKNFFKFVNDKRKTGGFPSTLKMGDKVANTPKDMADMFADFFSSVYSSEDCQRTANQFTPRNIIELPPLILSREGIELSLAKLSDSLNRGPDGLPACFLKRFAMELSSPLSIIFNCSLSSSSFPLAWKYSTVCPIFKKGSRSEATNYRCIAKLSFIPKVFEALVCEHVSFHAKPLIPESQHGFVKSRSTVTNLLDFTTFTINELENRNQVDAIYNDFSKAFDKVNHVILCQKLDTFGFTPRWVEWIKSYLGDRRMRVKLNETTSYSFTAKTGVPAGSHLGPLLFILFISDIEYCIKHSRSLLYADDLKIFRSITNEVDCFLLQEDLAAVARWCVLNALPLNESKCFCFTYTQKKCAFVYGYEINGCSLSRPNEVTDLGVTFNSNLSFVSHIDRVIARATASLGFVIRCSRDFHNPFTYKSLYCALVRSVLEYASVIWSPSYAVHIKRIESIQKRFLLFALRHRYARSDWQNLPSYCLRLTELNLPMLSVRRTTADVIFICKLLFGTIDLPIVLAAININTTINRRTRSNLIYVNAHRTNYGFNQPLARMERTFNEMSALIDFNMSVPSIRAAILNHYSNT